MFVTGRIVPKVLQDQMSYLATRGCILEKNVTSAHYVTASLCDQII